MSSPKSSGTTTPQSSTMSSPVSSGTTTPQQASTELQWANQPIGSSRVTVSVNPTAEAGKDTNFRPPVLPNGDNVIMYHYSPQYVPRQGPYFLANNGANYSCPNLYGFGTTNVTNWLQGNPQRPPTRLTSPLNPSAYPDNGNNNYLHGFNYMANQQYGPSLRPRSDPINIYRPRGQALCNGHLGIPSAATSNSIIIIPDDSPPQTLSAAPSSPLRTSSLLVPREEPEQDPTSQEEKPREQPEEEHKCLFCNKLFESGKALGGHMSSHEKKRKRERELTESVGKNFMAAAASTTADGAGTSSRPADGTEERDELEATDVEDEEEK